LTTGKQSKSSNEFNQYYNLESFILQKIIDQVLEKSNILITRSKTILEQEDLPVLNPHLLVNVNIGASNEELLSMVEALRSAINVVCSNISNENDLIKLQDEIFDY
jgi:hypothetical protein